MQHAPTQKESERCERRKKEVALSHTLIFEPPGRREETDRKVCNKNVYMGIAGTGTRQLDTLEVNGYWVREKRRIRF